MNIKTEALPKLKQAINKTTGILPIDVEKLVLFGSYARGEQNIYSDIDIAIVYKDNYTFFRQQEALFQQELQEQFSDNIEINFFRTTENKTGGANDFIKKEGITLWERGIAT